jgi:hypothetical protein
MITPESKANAFSFKVAASSWGDRASVPTQFIKDIDLMIETSSLLTGGKRPADDSIKMTRSFFNRVLRHAIDSLDELGTLSRPKIPELSSSVLKNPVF